MRPDRPISPQAMAIHRITEEMVADKPWIEEIIPHYHGSPWYVAHNASRSPGVAGDARRVDLYDEAGLTPVAGNQIQQYGVI